MSYRKFKELEMWAWPPACCGNDSTLNRRSLVNFFSSAGIKQSEFCGKDNSLRNGRISEEVVYTSESKPRPLDKQEVWLHYNRCAYKTRKIVYLLLTQSEKGWRKARKIMNSVNRLSLVGWVWFWAWLRTFRTWQIFKILPETNLVGKKTKS